MITPPTIQPGDTIALICPGSRCDDQHQVDATAHYLQTHYALKTVYREETYRKVLPADRADILLQYLVDPHIKALWALRGGEGTADLIPILHEKNELISTLTPKILLGFSDITALLLYFSQVYHWPVIHTFNARQFILNTISQPSKNAVFDLIFNQNLTVQIPIKPLNHAAKHKKIITGFAVGGNLTLINISIKETWEIQTENKLLFLEDVNEKPHAVIRTLKYFHRIGIFNKIHALILGQFILKKHEKALQPAMTRDLTKWSQTLDTPVLMTHEISHGKNNLPIPFYLPISCTG
jgi:muramoyltetrapeptide carboxypeptidase